VDDSSEIGSVNSSSQAKSSMPLPAIPPLQRRMSPPAQQIKVLPSAPAPAPPPPPKADDFFAEMGISAKPKFTATKASQPSRPFASQTVQQSSSRWQHAKPSAPPQQPHSLGAKQLPIGEDDLGGDADWGDDADLDDLLND